MVQPSSRRLVTEAALATSQGTQDTTIANHATRVAALETLGGLAPGSVSDATVSDLVANEASTTAIGLGAKFLKVTEAPVSPLRYGAVGNGVANDTAAFQSAVNAANGRNVLVPAGSYKISKVTLPSNTTLILSPGAVILHTNTGPVFEAVGTQSATKTPLTVTASKGQWTVTAPGHGLVAGDIFRLSSDKQFDAFSTFIKIGELCEVDSVSGDVITVVAPIANIASYVPAENAVLQKITPVRDVTITGGGKIQGLKSAAMGQYGISFLFAVDCLVAGIKTQYIDRRHIFLDNCLRTWANSNRLEWAVDNTQGYGVSFTNGTRDSGARFNHFTYIRHAVTTNNDNSNNGQPRRLVIADNIVASTSTALGGSMLGGDALDTHTAAEDVDFIRNWVLSSAGQGINFEARSGKIIDNHIFNTASNGISVHNESDFNGYMTVQGNEVRNTGGVGITARSGTRAGVVSFYEYLNVSDNEVWDTSGHGIQIGGSGTPANPAMTGARAHRNTIIRAAGTYAMFVNNVSGFTQSDNKAIGGTTQITVIDSAPPATGDHPGYRVSSIVSDTASVTPETRYLVIDTEGNAATDTLTTITGGLKGQVITVKTLANSRDVTLSTGGSTSGSLRTVSAMTLDAARDSITLGFDGTYWVELNRSDFPSA